MPALRSLIHESRATLVLAVPLMAGQLSQMLMGLTDSAMVGRVGVVPLAAAAFGNSILGVPMLVGIGLLVSVSVRVAQAHGANERAETGEVLRHGLVLSLIVGALLAAAVWALSLVLDRFGQPAEVAAEARNYVVIVGVSLIPMLASLALKQFSEALHHPWPPMLILLASVALNVVLNWIFIYGNLGAPALGLEGSAWATLLSRCAAVWAMWVFVRRARRFSEHAPAAWLRPLVAEKFRALVRLGLPASGMLVIESSAFSIAALMTGWLGAAPLAAHQIALSCASTTFMLPLGLSIAATIRVSQAVGANDHARLRAISVSALLLGVAIMAVCGLVLALARVPIAAAFVEDRAVIELAATLLVAAAVFQMFDGAQVVAAGVLRGLSDVNVPVALCVLAYWLISLPLGYAAAFWWGFGPLGVWIGLAAGLGIAAVLLVGRVLWRTRV
ncbi:MAG: MATE family efflux transporter [Chthoniobacteraceae bacterium]